MSLILPSRTHHVSFYIFENTPLSLSSFFLSFFLLFCMYSPVRTAREAFWHGLCFILFGLATVTARPAGLLLRFPTPVVVVGLLLDESSQTPIPLSGTPTPCFHLLLVTTFFLFFFAD